MPIDFPASPTNGQVFNSGTKVFVWDATLGAWVKYSSSVSNAAANSANEALGYLGAMRTLVAQFYV